MARTGGTEPVDDGLSGLFAREIEVGVARVESNADFVPVAAQRIGLVDGRGEHRGIGAHAVGHVLDTDVRPDLVGDRLPTRAATARGSRPNCPSPKARVWLQ